MQSLPLFQRKNRTAASRRHDRATAPPAAPAVDLARAFVDEPELVRACLQGIEQRPPTEAKLIWEAAQTAVAWRPDYADLLYHASQAAVAAGECPAAAQMLARALELNPAYKDALILAARVALQQSELKRATAYLETALAAGADYPDVHVLIGTVWQEQGNVTLARAAYERALQLNANLVSARTALAALATQSAESARGGLSDELSA